MFLRSREILQVLIFQFFLIFFIFTAVFFIFEIDFCLSFFYGGLSSFIPSLVFLIVFFLSKHYDSKVIIRLFYFSCFLKLFLLFIICFFLFFNGFIVNPVAYFCSLFLIQILFWFGCFYLLSGDIC